jgi:hypothetical protein
LDVEDTTLDAANPDICFGEDDALRLRSRQRAIVLIAFKQLNRAIIRGSKIDSVSLTLHLAQKPPADAKLRIYRVLLPWRDGGADGEKLYWAATYNSRFHSGSRNRRPWARPGAAKPGVDRAAQPSLESDISRVLSADGATVTLMGGRLVEDVRYWLDHCEKNFGWLIELASLEDTETSFWSSDCMNQALVPKLAISFTQRAEAVKRGVDLNVTFIERTPRYLRYHDDGETSYHRRPYRRDNPGIMKTPKYASEKKWPEFGEAVSFTAHVKNTGAAIFNGSVPWEFRLNDRPLKSGTWKGKLNPDEEFTISLPWKWYVDHKDHRDLELVFEVDKNDTLKEITKNNNLRRKYVEAKTLKYWVEQGAYDYISERMNALGSFSFEDYVQWQVSLWNDTFLDKSRFAGVAPDGSFERITLDDFQIVPNGKLSGGIHRYEDKPDCRFDGEWGTEFVPAKSQNDTEKENFLRFSRSVIVQLEGSLIHEATHQCLGDFDEYWSNLEPSEPLSPNGKVKVKDGGETYITFGDMYAYAGLMGGGDTRPGPGCYEGTGLYSLNSVMRFNSNLAYRNGFFGEHQYDLPRKCFIRALSQDGTPLANAKIKIWQCSGNELRDEDVVAEEIITDEDGLAQLPDQDSGELSDVTTITGHTLLKKNPFGRIEVVGTNTNLMLRCDAFGQRDYQFLKLLFMNTAYWQGLREEAVFDIRFEVVPSAQVDWGKNLALGCRAASNLNSAEAARLTDGDLKTGWNGGNAPDGSWILLDLGEGCKIAAVELLQSSAHGAFFSRFDVEVSSSGPEDENFSPFASQRNHPFQLAMTNRRRIDPADTSVRWVRYCGRIQPCRFLRIRAVQGGWSHLEEIRVYGTNDNLVAKE